MSRPTRVTNRLRLLRLERDRMTQAELARLAGVTRQTIIAIEGGRYAPSLELAFLLARALGVPLEEAFQYPDNPGDDAGDDARA